MLRLPSMDDLWNAGAGLFPNPYKSGVGAAESVKGSECLQPLLPLRMGFARLMRSVHRSRCSRCLDEN